MRTGLSPPVPVLGDQRALDHDGGDQDPAVDDLQPRRVDLEVREQVLQQVDREGAEDDADQPAAAARERRAAEHDRRDGRERVLRRARGVRRLHERGRARGRRHRRRGRRARSWRSRTAVTLTPAEKAVASLEPTANSSRRNGHVLEHEPDQQRCADREERAGNRADLAREVVDPAMLLAQRDGIRGEQQVDALEREVHRERDHDRLHAQDRDHRDR